MTLSRENVRNLSITLKGFLCLSEAVPLLGLGNVHASLAGPAGFFDSYSNE